MSLKYLRGEKEVNVNKGLITLGYKNGKRTTDIRKSESKRLHSKK